MNELKIASICLNSTDNFTKNLDRAEFFVKKAAKEGAAWVLLPEVFPYYGPYEKNFEYGEKEGGPVFSRFSALAKELKIVLFCGTMGEHPADNMLPSLTIGPQGYKKVFNTLYIFDRSGSLLAKYRKTHLFNLFGKNKEKIFLESDGFLPGNELKIVEIDSFKVGLAICFELRFGEIFSALSKLGPPDVLAIPAAFTYDTGLYHWELLLRARAVENLCYVYAANQTGKHGPGRKSCGHSMIVDPWGNKISDTGDEEGVTYAQISKKRLEGCRIKLPVQKNRRPELY